MRWTKGLMIAALCAVPMIASASGFVERDTFQAHADIVVNPDPVNVPEPGTLALLLAGVGGVAAATRRRRRNRDDR